MQPQSLTPRSTPAAIRRMPRTVTRSEIHGHVLKWTPCGGECVQCGAAMADSDAQAFEHGASGDILGAFVRPCPASSAAISLSEQQRDRMERFSARFPATRFEITAQDPYSAALTVEVEDLETSAVLTISATGRTLEA